MRIDLGPRKSYVYIYTPASKNYRTHYEYTSHVRYNRRSYAKGTVDHFLAADAYEVHDLPLIPGN